MFFLDWRNEVRSLKPDRLAHRDYIYIHWPPDLKLWQLPL